MGLNGGEGLGLGWSRDLRHPWHKSTRPSVSGLCKGWDEGTFRVNCKFGVQGILPLRVLKVAPIWVPWGTLAPR